MGSDADDVKLGFLVITESDGTFTGGLLVTNNYGLPVEFRCTTEVKPTRAQRILYGGTLERFVKVDLIGQKLIKAIENTPAILLVDDRVCLELGSATEIPVGLARATEGAGLSDETVVIPSCPDGATQVEVRTLPERNQDLEAMAGLLGVPATKMSLLEPFARVLDALAEVALSKK